MLLTAWERFLRPIVVPHTVLVSKPYNASFFPGKGGEKEGSEPYFKVSPLDDSAAAAAATVLGKEGWPWQAAESPSGNS